MSNLLAESRLSLSALARRENVAVSTTWRWALRGVRGVTLESLSIGGKRYTTSEAFARFVEATTAASRGGYVAPSINNSKARRDAAIARAETELDESGI